ncbi:tail fiber domain-containing protein [Acetobacter thailandicus]|uniref:Tail fiber domain-containing protein n=1 Tax=Acetobacter thailandicus TaxID=1502842 RepID=A0ABT3QDG2_9PROT|nr:tail fiber domain-containing protein [Acetobacter thailandicus]MCX2563328.1 tail fiber domain-containing protein [Acetobacter thailandicus]NHN94082.1 hypothetical protein [Acetobacter thailandicus]
MSTATGTPVFVSVGGDASLATATYTASGATTSTTVTLGDLAASVGSNSTDIATATTNAATALSKANAAQSAANSASTTAASALSVANAAIPATKIGATSGVVGIDSQSRASIPNGAQFGASATNAIAIQFGNGTNAIGSVYQWYYVNGTSNADIGIQFTGGSTADGGQGSIAYSAIQLAPASANVTALGTASSPWSGVVSQTAVQVVSDANDKTVVGTIGASDYTAETTKLRAAWAAISGVVYTLNFRTNKRNHIGVIAQTVQSAFTAQGLDPSDYGLWCSTPKTKQVESTVDGETVYTTEPVYEADGKTQATQQTIRYEELLTLGIFCERLERADLAARVTSLESKSTTTTTTASTTSTTA